LAQSVVSLGVIERWFHFPPHLSSALQVLKMWKYRQSVKENQNSGYIRLIGNQALADRVLSVSTRNWECRRPCAQSGRQWL